MRRLVVEAFVSLDGVMQAPGGPTEDLDGGFGHGGWVVPFIDDLLGRADEGVSRLSALLLGRRTYEEFAASWPLVGNDNPVAAAFNRVPKYVATRTLSDPTWAHTTVLGPDLAAEVRALKNGPEDGVLQVHGSSVLIQELLRHDLVDVFRIKVFPVVIGTGKRLFGAGSRPCGLALTETVTSPHGVIMSSYERSGELRTGTYGAELDVPESAE